jgi:hypothetical protein
MFIRIVGDTTKYQGKLERIGLHLIKVSGLIQHESGFRLYLDNDVMIGDYSKFIYPYEDPNLGEGVYMYSDNNLVYEEEVNKPTIEEEKERKVKDIIAKTVGDDVTLLSQQVNETNDMLIAMYGILSEIQAALIPSEEEEEKEKPIDESVEEESTEKEKEKKR